MNQESNPHSPSANFGEKVVDALWESLKDVEVTVQTYDGVPTCILQGSKFVNRQRDVDQCDVGAL